MYHVYGGAQCYLRTPLEGCNVNSEIMPNKSIRFENPGIAVAKGTKGILLAVGRKEAHVRWVEEGPAAGFDVDVASHWRFATLAHTSLLRISM